MLKKIAAGAALAATLAFSVTAPAVLSAQSNLDTPSITAVGNWPDPMQLPQSPLQAPAAVGNWPDPMAYILYVGNWPDPM
jgi:hypothetical protein